VKKFLDKERKINICFDLAKIIFTIHSLTPPMYHGHLTSHNVFVEYSTIDKKFNVKISEVELSPLIKYANTFSDYRNVSVWSSPECMALPKKVQDPLPEMDVYSFGMLLWELWHE
jgi:hypothetical protein